jgi:hypothetical protein
MVFKQALDKPQINELARPQPACSSSQLRDEIRGMIRCLLIPAAQAVQPQARRTMKPISSKRALIPIVALAFAGGTAANAQLVGGVSGHVDATAHGTLATPRVNVPNAAEVAERRADYAKRQAEAAKQRAERRAKKTRETGEQLAERRKDWARNQAELAAERTANRVPDKVELPDNADANAKLRVEGEVEASVEPRS